MTISEIQDRETAQQRIATNVSGIYQDMPAPLLASKQSVAEEFERAWTTEGNEGEIAHAVLYRNPVLWEEREALLFGNLEFNTPEAGAAIIKHVIEAAKSSGARELIGPLNGNTWNDYRLSLMGSQPAFPGEPFNPEGYLDLLKQSGFRVLNTYGSGLDESLDYDLDKLQSLRQNLEGQGLTFHTLDQGNLEEDLQLVHALCSKAFVKNFLFTPISQGAFMHKYRQMLRFVDTRFSTLAMLNGKLAAFMFAYPNPLDASGKTLVIKTVARDPDHSPSGLGQYLVGLTTQMASEAGMQSMIHALMPDESHSNIISQFYSGVPYRYYELLHLPLRE